jgi:hypothetical protein
MYGVIKKMLGKKPLQDAVDYEVGRIKLNMDKSIGEIMNRDNEKRSDMLTVPSKFRRFLIKNVEQKIKRLKSDSSDTVDDSQARKNIDLLGELLSHLLDDSNLQKTTTIPQITSVDLVSNGVLIKSLKVMKENEV